MPTDNVVPIDAEVARAIARRAVKFRWFVAGLAALWLGILVPVLLFTPLPPLVPLLVLGALLVLAEHRFVLFGDETSMSGSIIVAIASVFVFADTAPLAGPMLVAALGGLYFPHIRERRCGIAISNAAGFSLSALAAAPVAAAFGYPGTAPWPTLATCVVIAVGADWIVNSFVVGIASSVRCSEQLGTSLRAQLLSDADVLILAIAIGALSALNAGALAPAVLSAVLALAAFELRLRRAQSPERGASHQIDRYLHASLVAVAAMLAWSDPGLAAVAVVALAVFLVQTTDRALTLPAFIGVAVGIFVAAALFTAEIPATAITAFVLVAAFGAIETVAIVARAKRSGRSLNVWTLDGLILLGRRELAFLGALALAISASTGASGSWPPTAVALVFVAGTVLSTCLEGRSDPLGAHKARSPLLAKGRKPFL